MCDAKSLALCLMARTCWGFSRVHAEIDRANLVQHAEEWKWSSLWCRERGSLEQQKCLVVWPLPCPRGWMKYVNDPETEVELNALRRCVNRGCVKRGQPFGSDRWIEETAQQLNLESTLRTPGRPRHSQCLVRRICG